jgi:hypothetical protein
LEFFDQSGLATGKKKAHQIGARALRLAYSGNSRFGRVRTLQITILWFAPSSRFFAGSPKITYSFSSFAH